MGATEDNFDISTPVDCPVVECAVARILAGRQFEPALTDREAGTAANYIGSIWHVAPAAIPLFLEKFDDQLKPGTCRRLTAIAGAATIHGRVFRQIGAEVSEFFAREGIELVALKGTASGFAGYADPAQRTGADLDFCVRHETLEVSKDIMRSAGFWPGDYDAKARVFLPSDDTVRAAREEGHYALGFWVRIVDLGEVSPAAAEGFRMAGDLLPFASEVDGRHVRTPVLVDIHHSVGAGVSARDILDRPRRHEWNGAQILLPPREWMAFHSLLKLYWESGQAYRKGFQYLADFARILPLLNGEEIDALIGLVEAHNLKPGGHYVLRHLLTCMGINIPVLASALNDWAIPPSGETPESYNDIGDFWPRLFGRL